MSYVTDKKSRDIMRNPKQVKKLLIRNINLKNELPVVAYVEISIKDPFYKILTNKIDKLRSYEYDEV